MVVTGIFKEAVAGRVAVRRLNLEGDRQADLSVHGGSEKAVYAYPAEYYPFWQEQFPEMELPWGMFGENLTVAGLLDETVHIGDCFQVGSAHLVVTQPRLPCYKLGLKFGRDDILKRFLQSELTGFYFAVLKEGEVAAGDPISLLHHERITIVLKKCPGSVRERKKYLCNTCFLCGRVYQACVKRCEIIMITQRVAIVIPALNEEAALHRLLAELPRTFAQWIIVVDNGSTDRNAGQGGTGTVSHR